MGEPLSEGWPPEWPSEWLEGYQGGRASPLGQALRSTFDADNHHTLGSDVTGLMIDLSKVPYGDEPGVPAPVPAPVSRPLPPAPPPPAARTSWLGWLAEMFGRRAV